MAARPPHPESLPESLPELLPDPQTRVPARPLLFWTSCAAAFGLLVAAIIRLTLLAASQ